MFFLVLLLLRSKAVTVIAGIDGPVVGKSSTGWCLVLNVRARAPAVVTTLADRADESEDIQLDGGMCVSRRWCKRVVQTKTKKYWWEFL